MLISLPHAETYSFPSDVNMWQLIGNALCSSYGWWYTLSIFVRSTVMDDKPCTHNSIICIRRKRWRKLYKKKNKWIIVMETGVLSVGVHAHCIDVYILLAFFQCLLHLVVEVIPQVCSWWYWPCLDWDSLTFPTSHAHTSAGWWTSGWDSPFLSWMPAQGRV